MRWPGIHFQCNIAVTLCWVMLLPAGRYSMAAVGDTSLAARYGFKSLFTNDRFDATKPYAAQLNPRAVSFVQEYIRKQGRELERMKGWGRPYFDLYDNILHDYGLPREMKYLSVIESHLNSGLVSWAGAVGPWQLMDYEARRFGLRVGGRGDERMDYYKSTHVAAKLMKELYDEFGDWLLVVAAYNGGSGRVRQAIRKAGSRDFWNLQYYLPEETRNHVKKFIGTHYIFEGSGGLTTMTAAETELQRTTLLHPTQAVLSEEELANTAVIEIGGRYSSAVLVSHLALEPQRFNKWNPGIDKALAAGKKYFLRLPKDKIPVFEASKEKLLMESVRMLLESPSGR